MNIGNRIENIIIGISVAILTALIMNFMVIKPMRNDFARQLDKQNGLIKELAMLEKYQIENNFDKLKSHKGQIVLDLDNAMTVINKASVVINKSDVIKETEKEKKGFFKRLFGGK